MTTDLKRFLWVVFLVALPELLITASYFLYDPFQVLYKYEEVFDVPGSIRNMDFISTETYKRNHPHVKYDSFIFGNSRSQVYRTTAWKQHLQQAAPFHFAASLETIFGISKKIDYIKSNNETIENALIILDESVLSITENSKGVLVIKHPEISGESSLAFQTEYFKAYMKEFYFVKYIYFRLTGKSLPHTASPVLDQKMIHDKTTNDVRFKFMEDAISADSISHYKSKIFYFRSGKKVTSEKVINERGIVLLKNIVSTFKADGTKYKIVISPLYDQIYFNPDDLTILQSIFGKENVYDFSGINDFTIPLENYYEFSHYKPAVANKIMDSIYRN
jgi:hypothetical protein